MNEQLKKVKQLVELRRKARLGGGEKAIDKQHEKGKYTARERIALLLDKGSFEEMDMFKLHRCHDFGMDKKQYLGDGVVAGSGTINGRLVFIFAQDFTVNGGSLSITMAEKICKVMDLAMKTGAPCIGLNDSGGARIQEGINALAGFGEIFQRNIEASGVIPQISGICGPCAGGAVYSPALTDFVVMLEGVSYMFLTGPKVVKTVTGEDVTQEQLGGANVHASISGVAHFTAKTEEEFALLIRHLLEYLPQNNLDHAPLKPTNDPIDRKEDALNEIVPDNPNQAYDMYNVISAIVDDGEFMEVQSQFARNIIIGFARFNGQSVMVIGHQKGRDTKEKIRRNFGMPRPEGYRKALRLMQTAEKFNIPVMTFVDTPGAYPGIGAEERGQSEAIGRNLYELTRLRVPVLCTIIGEGGSGGALAIAVGDYVNMLQYSTYSVISPEGCASILWKTAEKAADAAQALGITAKRLQELDLIDSVINEPLGGAHRDFETTMKNVKTVLETELHEAQNMPMADLLARRFDRIMAYGKFTDK